MDFDSIKSKGLGRERRRQAEQVSAAHPRAGRPGSSGVGVYRPIVEPFGWSFLGNPKRGPGGAKQD